VLVATFIAAAADPSSASRISGYQPIFRPFYGEDGTIQVAIRSYKRDDDDRLLLLDPHRFTIRESAAAPVLSSRAAGDEAWQETPFARALARQTAPPYPLQNDGLREAEIPGEGFFLTADLCPTKKPLDRRFFEATMGLPQEKPIPVAVMVSGLWLQGHQADLAWLKEQDAAGRIAITWVNHSFTHFYDPALPLEKNFLLKRGTNFASEVLSLEMLLLQHDLVPSPFFRFPGLVSNRQLIEQLRDLHLIPIGSNAWLAKGESPQPGSIILVHANGNEPAGIRLLTSFYDENREGFRQGRIAILPLRRAFLLP
jgi:hypothetical protein